MKWLMMGLFFSSFVSAENLLWDLRQNETILGGDFGVYSSPQAACATVHAPGPAWERIGPVPGNPSHPELGWLCVVMLSWQQHYQIVYPLEVQNCSDGSCSDGYFCSESTGACKYITPYGSPSSCSLPGSQSEDQGFVGNPINFITGKKHQYEQDLGGNIPFGRYYNASGQWWGTYSSRLLLSVDAAVVMSANGRSAIFKRDGDDFISQQSGNGLLRRQGDDLVYVSSSNMIQTFNASGRLVRQQAGFSDISLAYLEDGNIEVSDSYENKISFTEDYQGQPLTLKSEAGSVRFEYDRFYGNARLTRAIVKNNGVEHVRNYHYEDRNPKLLTGITDERGVRYASWRYDISERAISSEHAGGADRVEIAYNDDGSATVTNELGKKATYRFQTIQGIKRITAIEGEPSPNCPSSNSTFTYDDRGLLKTKTDNKGIVTTYDYNDRGLEVTRTEASGTPQARMVTTEWHPSLYLPLAVTEPDRITRYQYDDQGRQLSQTVENL